MDTRRISLQGVTVRTKDSNAGLWLDKFIAGQNRKDERTENSADKFKQQLIGEMTKIETPDVYKIFFDRWQNSLDGIGAQFRGLEIDGRMAIGLGAESVAETSIALHRTYGVPFIPGSALKGLAASYAHKHLGGDWKKETKTTKLGKAHEFVFGSQESAGFITFHDALLIPKTKTPLRADVMTVHHADYYGDKKDNQGNLLPPADWDNPVPIPFLSATGEFLAAISGTQETKDWIEFVWLILEKALQEEGIGAKTSSGYGRAKLTEDYPRTATMEASENARKKAEREEIEAAKQAADRQVLIDAQKKHEDYQTQREADEQAKKAQQQQNAEKDIIKYFEQIKAVETASKKTKKIFNDLTQRIYRLDKGERRREFAADALTEAARLDVKIETSDKWFGTLKTMSREM